MVTKITGNMTMNFHILLVFLILHSVPFLRLPDIPVALEAPHAERKVLGVVHRQ